MLGALGPDKEQDVAGPRPRLDVVEDGLVVGRHRPVAIDAAAPGRGLPQRNAPQQHRGRCPEPPGPRRPRQARQRQSRRQEGQGGGEDPPVHPRPVRRHPQPGDVQVLRAQQAKLSQQRRVLGEVHREIGDAGAHLRVLGQQVAQVQVIVDAEAQHLHRRAGQNHGRHGQARRPGLPIPPEGLQPRSQGQHQEGHQRHQEARPPAPAAEPHVPAGIEQRLRDGQQQDDDRLRSPAPPEGREGGHQEPDQRDVEDQAAPGTQQQAGQALVQAAGETLDGQVAGVQDVAEAGIVVGQRDAAGQQHRRGHDEPAADQPPQPGRGAGSPAVLPLVDRELECKDRYRRGVGRLDRHGHAQRHAGGKKVDGAPLVPVGQESGKGRQQGQRGQRLAEEDLGVGPGHGRQPKEQRQRRGRAFARPAAGRSA